jgi:hypothetical protein
MQTYAARLGGRYLTHIVPAYGVYARKVVVELDDDMTPGMTFPHANALSVVLVP